MGKGAVARIVLLVGLVGGLMSASACAFDDGWAAPTDETGRGVTEELEEALAQHDLRLPADASQVSYTLHSSIDSSSLGLRFRTTSVGLTQLLASLERSEGDLVPGLNPWDTSSRLSERSPARFGWDLTSVASSEGLEVPRQGSLGAYGVLIDSDDPTAPVVYVEALACC